MMDFFLGRTNKEISLVEDLRRWMPESLRQLSTWACIKIMGRITAVQQRGRGLADLFSIKGEVGDR
jgi:hypothetical protein